MAIRLTCRGGALTGFADGKIVNCLVRSAQPGVFPTRGEYRVAAPTNDLIYGPVAIMVRAGAGVDPGVSQQCIRRLPAPGAAGMATRGIAEMTKQEMPGAAAALTAGLPASGGTVFVLASRSIGGRNCLVVDVSSGLFEAIAAGGGAEIAVT